MSSSLALRIVSALGAIAAIFVSTYFFQSAGLYSLASVVFLAMAYECGSLSFKEDKSFLALLPLHAAHFAFFYFFPELNNLFYIIFIEVLVWLWIHRFTSTQEEPFYSNHGRLHEFLFYSLVAPTFLLAHMTLTERFQSVFFLLFVVAAFDTLSYFWGRLLGGRIFKTHLYKLSSPSKTLEGALFAAASCVPLTLVLDKYFPEYSFLQYFQNTGLKVALSLLVVLAALSGDLSESIIKRSAKVKDSGKLLPGHGGFFDRLDGLLFAGIISYLLLQF